MEHNCSQRNLLETDRLLDEKRLKTKMGLPEFKMSIQKRISGMKLEKLIPTECASLDKIYL